MHFEFSFSFDNSTCENSHYIRNWTNKNFLISFFSLTTKNYPNDAVKKSLHHKLSIIVFSIFSLDTIVKENSLTIFSLLKID